MHERNALLYQILRFALVSGVAFAIDALVFFGLSEHMEIDDSWSKRISFACVSVWGFLAHKRFTFRHREFNASEPVRFAFVYLSGWVLNSVVYDGTIALDRSSKPAFLVATFAWACWNFIGQKYFVFRDKRSD